MRLMIAEELGSTELPEMSLFHALSAGKGNTPLRLAPAPVAIALHAEVSLEPDPPVPLPGPPELPPELEDDEPPVLVLAPPQPVMRSKAPNNAEKSDTRSIEFTP